LDGRYDRLEQRFQDFMAKRVEDHNISDPAKQHSYMAWHFLMGKTTEDRRQREQFSRFLFYFEPNSSVETDPEVLGESDHVEAEMVEYEQLDDGLPIFPVHYHFRDKWKWENSLPRTTRAKLLAKELVMFGFEIDIENTMTSLPEEKSVYHLPKINIRPLMKIHKGLLTKDLEKELNIKNIPDDYMKYKFYINPFHSDHVFERPAILKNPPKKKDPPYQEKPIVDSTNPMAFIYTRYVNDTTDPRFTRKIWLKLLVGSLKLPPLVKERFLALVGNRYDPEEDILTLSSSNKITKHENRRRILLLLRSYLDEAWAVDLNYIPYEHNLPHIDVEDKVIEEQEKELNDIKHLDLSRWTTFKFHVNDSDRKSGGENVKELLQKIESN